MSVEKIREAIDAMGARTTGVPEDFSRRYRDLLHHAASDARHATLIEVADYVAKRIEALQDGEAWLEFQEFQRRLVAARLGHRSIQGTTE